MIGLELFDKLPKDYKDAVNYVVEEVLCDKSPDMNDAFRVWQAEILLTGVIIKEDWGPDLWQFKIEALAFRGGWEKRERAQVVSS